jgi:signal transduction histidine kinase
VEHGKGTPTFEEIYEAYADRVLNLAYRMTADEEIALKQKILLKYAEVIENRSTSEEVLERARHRRRQGLVRGFLATNHHIFQKCDIHVETSHGKGFYQPVIISLFEILLMNILTNAKKYNESGRPSIRIIFEEGESIQLIRFRDNGIGLEKGERMAIKF